MPRVPDCWSAIERVVDGQYMDHLRRVQEGLYDANERLCEGRLAELVNQPSCSD